MSLANRQRLLSASTINGFGFLIASAVAIAWWLLVTRRYPADESGRLILAISVAGIVNMLDLGISQALVGLISARQGVPTAAVDAQNLFKTALAGVLLLEGLVGIAGLAWWVADHRDDAFFTPGIAVLVLCFALSTQALQLCIGMFKGSLQFRPANMVSTGSTVLVYGGGVVLAFLRSPVRDMLAVMAITQVLASLVAVHYALWRPVPAVVGHRPETRWKIARTLLSVSLPLYPQMFTGIFFNHVQRFLIARFVGLDAVAVLSLAFSIATRLHAVVNAFLEVLFPMAKHMKDAGLRLVPFCVRTGGIAALCYLGCAAFVVVAALVGMPSLAQPFGLFALGVACSVAVAPAFHLLNGTGEAWQVSLASALSPLMFLVFALALHLAASIEGHLLLPLSYACASLVMVGQILFVLFRLEHRSGIRA